MACEKKNYEEIIAAYLAADTNKEKQYLQQLSQFKFDKITVKKEQQESWNNTFFSGLEAIQQASPKEPSFLMHLMLLLSFALFALVFCSVALALIGLPISIILGAIAGVFAGLFFLELAYYVICTNKYKNERINYSEKLIDHEFLHPDVVFAYKILSLMEYYQKNQQLLELDLSNCLFTLKSLGLIEEAMKNNAMVTIILPSFPNIHLMQYSDRNKIEISISNIGKESDKNSFYGTARQFFWSEKLISSDPSKIPLNVFTLILHNLAAVFHISDGALIPKWNLFQPLPKFSIADLENQNEEQPSIYPQGLAMDIAE